MAGAEGAVVLFLGGVPRVDVAGSSLVLERKAAGLLAWLALKGPTTRERVAAMLWPEASAEAGRNSLRQLLFKLRKVLGPGVLDGGEWLQLSPDVRVDADRSLPLLDGHDFGDCPEYADWLNQCRERWSAEALEAALRACDAAEAAGDLSHAAELARALVERDPLGEPGQQRWARMLYLRGERAAALAALQSFEKRLRDELGVAPSPEIQRLITSLGPQPVPGRSRLDPPVPVTVLRPPRLVGREAAVAAVRQARAEGTVPLIVGEPGQGKSRLVAELLGQGDRVVAARPSDAGVPYASLSRVLRSIASEWPEALFHVEAPALRPLLPDLIADPRPDPQAITRSSPVKAAELSLSLAHERGLAALWLDDLHFFDGASLEALTVLMDAAPLAGLAFGLARRPAEGDAALSRLVDRLIDGDRLAEVPLQPLGEADLAEFVNSLGLPGVDGMAIAPSLWRSTGGNPLFVLETLKAAWLEGHHAGVDPGRLPRPSSVMSLIQRRLSRLSPTALNLARVAALAGPDFDAELAVAVLERPALDLADAWAELEAAQILRDQAFAHDLIFEGTLASVPPAIRRATRRTIASILEGRGGEPARIALHWLAAEEPARAAPQLRAAARRAESALRYAEARDAMAKAADCFDAAGQGAEALVARVALANLWVESGDPEQALALLQALAEAPVSADEQLKVAYETVKCLTWLGRPDEAARWGLQRLDDPDLMESASARPVAHLRSAVADASNSARRPEQALAQLTLAGPFYAASTDAQECGWYHSDMATALRRLGRYGPARDHLAQALALARQTGRLRMVAGVLQVIAGVEHDSGHLLPALERAEECQRLMTSVDQDVPFSFVVDTVIAREQVQLGRLSAACERLDALLPRAAEAPGLWAPFLHAWRLRAWTWAGQPERARDSAEALAAGPVVPAVDSVRATLALDLAALRATGAPALTAWDVPFDRGGLQASDATLLARAWCHAAEVPDLQPLREAAQLDGDAGKGLMVELVACRVAAQAGDGPAARRAGEATLAALRRVTVPGLYRPTLWLSMADALQDLAPDLAWRAWRDGVDWVQSIARFHLPPDGRQAFLERNAVNRRLLSLQPPAGAA